MSYEDKVLANIDQEKDNLINMMQELIRINTVNPPGNESRAAEYLEPIYRPILAPTSPYVVSLSSFAALISSG